MGSSDRTGSVKQRKHPVQGQPMGLPKGAPFGWLVSGKSASAPVDPANTLQLSLQNLQLSGENLQLGP